MPAVALVDSCAKYTTGTAAGCGTAASSCSDRRFSFGSKLFIMRVLPSVQMTLHRIPYLKPSIAHLR